MYINIQLSAQYVEISFILKISNVVILVYKTVYVRIIKLRKFIQYG